MDNNYESTMVFTEAQKIQSQTSGHKTIQKIATNQQQEFTWIDLCVLQSVIKLRYAKTTLGQLSYWDRLFKRSKCQSLQTQVDNLSDEICELLKRGSEYQNSLDKIPGFDITEII